MPLHLDEHTGPQHGCPREPVHQHNGNNPPKISMRSHAHETQTRSRTRQQQTLYYLRQRSPPTATQQEVARSNAASSTAQRQHTLHGNHEKPAPLPPRPHTPRPLFSIRRPSRHHGDSVSPLAPRNAEPTLLRTPQQIRYKSESRMSETRSSQVTAVNLEREADAFENQWAYTNTPCEIVASLGPSPTTSSELQPKPRGYVGR